MKNTRIHAKEAKPAKKAVVGYMGGGLVGTKTGIKPTNTKTMTMRGGGAAERGKSYKG